MQRLLSRGVNVVVQGRPVVEGNQQEEHVIFDNLIGNNRFKWLVANEISI